MTNLSIEEKQELRIIFDKKEKNGIVYRIWILLLKKLGIK